MSEQSETLELGNYRILNKDDGSLWMLGRGGYGTTYKAEHKHLGRECALKVINDELMRDNAARRRFLQEAQAAALLDHPHIARIYDFGESDGVFYYAMTYCAGGDLEAFSSSRGAQPWSVVKELAKQMLSALVMAHGKGLLHRDLKPSNIMLSDDDGPVSLRLIDFGLVKVLDNHDFASTNLMLTQEGSFMGNPLTASPEQLREEDLDARSDLFSLGVTLWYLLVGGAPFKNISTAELVHQRLGNESYTSMLPPDLDESGKFILGKLLCKNRQDRFSKAEEVLSAIESGKSGEVVESTAQKAPENGSNLVSMDAARDWTDVWEIHEQLLKFPYGTYYTCTGKLPGVPDTTMFVPDIECPYFESVCGHADKILHTDTQLLNGFYQKGQLSDEVAYVCPPFPTGSYQCLLQSVGVLSLQRHLDLLQQIARAVDESIDHDIPGVELEIVEVMFGLRDNATDGPKTEQEWTAYFQSKQHAGEDYISNLEITVLPKLVDSADLDEAMVTLGGDDLATNPIARFGGLLYRSITGMSVKQAAYLSPSAHIPSSNLSEESNRFMSKVISAREMPASAVGLLQKLCDLEGVDWKTDILDATRSAKEAQKSMMTQSHASVSSMMSSMPASSQSRSSARRPSKETSMSSRTSLGKMVEPKATTPTGNEAIQSQSAQTHVPVQAAAPMPAIDAAPATNEKTKTKKSKKGLVIAAAAVCFFLLAALGFGIWHFGKEDKPRHRRGSGESAVTVENPVTVDFTDVTMSSPDAANGIAAKLLDSKGEPIGTLELKGNRAQGNNIPAELFNDASRWPVKLQATGEGYKISDVVLELADFTDSGDDHRRYNKTLKLDLRAYLRIAPIVQFEGKKLQLPLTAIAKHLRPENPLVDLKLGVEEGKISVMLPVGNKFPLKAMFTIPHMKEIYFTLQDGDDPTLNLQLKKKEVRFSGLGKFTALKFLPKLEKIEDQTSKQILAQHLGDYTAQVELFDEGRGVWELPALDGEIEVAGVEGKWTFDLSASAKWRVLTSSDQSDKTMEIGSEAFLKLSQLAQSGDKDSQYELGLAYLNGDGVAANEKASTEWFRMAAEQGDKAAQHNLAIAYEIGRGVTADKWKAVDWYSKAAKQGYADSQMGLALCYQQGRGVPKNYQEAERLFGLAAAQGNAPAMYNLAILYQDKNAGMINENKAIALYKKAAELGHAASMYNLAYCYEYGEGGLEENLVEAIQYYEKAAAKNYEPAKKALDELAAEGNLEAEEALKRLKK